MNSPKKNLENPVDYTSTLCRDQEGTPLQRKFANKLVDIHEGVRFPKCPKWIHHRLIFLDVHARRIRSADMQGTVRTEVELPFLPGALEVSSAGEMLVGDALHGKLYSLRINSHEEAADLSPVAPFYLSDAIVATQGRTYIGDVGYDFLNPLVDPVPGGSIMFVDDQGRVTLAAEDLFFPNGMVITPDGNTLIVSETLGHRLTAFDIAEDGSLGKGHLWASLPDDVNPDGICIDEESAIWVATRTPRALRILEGGEIVDAVFSEQRVYAVALGGSQRKQLFLCTSASADAVVTRQTPGASIEIATVQVPGIPACPDKQSVVARSTNDSIN